MRTTPPSPVVQLLAVAISVCRDRVNDFKKEGVKFICHLKKMLSSCFPALSDDLRQAYVVGACAWHFLIVSLISVINATGLALTINDKVTV